MSPGSIPPRRRPHPRPRRDGRAASPSGRESSAKGASSPASNFAAASPIAWSSSAARKLARDVVDPEHRAGDVARADRIRREARRMDVGARRRRSRCSPTRRAAGPRRDPRQLAAPGEHVVGHLRRTSTTEPSPDAPRDGRGASRRSMTAATASPSDQRDGAYAARRQARAQHHRQVEVLAGRRVPGAPAAPPTLPVVLRRPGTQPCEARRPQPRSARRRSSTRSRPPRPAASRTTRPARELPPDRLPVEPPHSEIQRDVVRAPNASAPRR